MFPPGNSMKDPNNMHRAVLVGCGVIANTWAAPIRDLFSDRIRLVGFVDLDEERARRFAEKWGSGDVAVGKQTKPIVERTGADVVFNCTLPGVHMSTGREALEAGCHVLMEKPLAPTAAEVREFAAFAKERGRLLAAIQNRRYLGGAKAVQRALSQGVVGRLHTVHTDFFVGPHFGGFREEMEHPLLIDMAIHTFDAARHLTGLNPRRVMCHEFNPTGSWFRHGASACALFEMEEGVVFSYRGSWVAQGFPTTWESSWRIVGEKGTLLWDGADEIAAETVSGSEGFIYPVARRRIESIELRPEQRQHAGNILEFLDALDGGPEPQTVASDNAWSIAMVEHAIRSARERRWVDVE